MKTEWSFFPKLTTPDEKKWFCVQGFSPWKVIKGIGCLSVSSPKKRGKLLLFYQQQALKQIVKWLCLWITVCCIILSLCYILPRLSPLDTVVISFRRAVFSTQSDNFSHMLLLNLGFWFNSFRKQILKGLCFQFHPTRWTVELRERF